MPILADAFSSGSATIYGKYRFDSGLGHSLNGHALTRLLIAGVRLMAGSPDKHFRRSRITTAALVLSVASLLLAFMNVSELASIRRSDGICGLLLSPKTLPLQASLLGVSLAEWYRDRRLFRLVAVGFYPISTLMLFQARKLGQFGLSGFASVMMCLWLPASIVLVAVAIRAVYGD